jgi:predicted dehydrogenase
MIKIAIIGAGKHGLRNLKLINGDPNLEVAYIVDINSSALEAVPLPDHKKCLAIEDLDSEKIDIALVLTSADSHSKIYFSLAAIGIRKILIEKPMACSIQECQEMIEHSQSLGIRLSVNQSRRVSRFYNYFKNDLLTGRLGKLNSIYIQRSGIGLGCLGTHYIDLVCFLFDRNPKSVSGWIDVFKGPNPRGEKFIDPGGLIFMDMGDESKAIILQVEDAKSPMSVELITSLGRIRIEEKFNRVIYSIFDKKNNDFGEVDYLETEDIGLDVDVLSMMSGAIYDLASKEELVCQPIFGLNAIKILALSYESNSLGHIPQEFLKDHSQAYERYLTIT